MEGKGRGLKIKIKVFKVLLRCDLIT